MKSLAQAKFHFVGIGGIGMCGLAELLQAQGALVTGSDLSENANTERLKKLGIRIFKGHAKENVGPVDVLVYSSAVQRDNPELIRAHELHIPQIPRAEALAELMRLKRGIAVGGTHGKTTTTAMISSVFLHGKLNPTIAIGGRLDLIQSTARLGDGDWFIAEADESDGSFHRLSPEIAVITNVDADHLDHFKSFENLQAAFYQFALKVPFYGQAIVCGDGPVVRALFRYFPKRIQTYGFEPHNDWILHGEKSAYSLTGPDETIVFRVPVPGRHNALNAAAALLVGRAAGLSWEQAVAGLATYQGVDRRFHYKGEGRGVAVYDDYGHHPTEVSATLQAFREQFPIRRLVVYFQPHRYSRTQLCWNDFLSCFRDCDVLWLGSIYPAGEGPIPGVSAEALCKDIQHSDKHLMEVRDPQKAAALLKAGDVFLTLGAGDGWKFGQQVLAELSKP